MKEGNVALLSFVVYKPFKFNCYEACSYES